jgi:N-acetylglucosaminyldiphosphoundecaprenol N-acetyl-beta-D-mannosaminyltransferase
MKAEDCRPAANVLGVDIDAIDMERALQRITVALQGSHKGYVCVAGVHGVMEAQRCPQLLDVYAGSEMTIPDGMPLVWVGHLQGHATMQRVTGPDLMLEVFRRKQFANLTHFLFGGDEYVAKELRGNLLDRFPWTKILGTYEPPFRELTASEEERFIATIRELKPDIIWVGISCPKQELLMARLLPMLETKLMFGVGAAFDYHTGRIRDCAEWIKRAGLQWLHRLVQDPRRLWRRYLRNNPAFVWRIFWQIVGVKRYSRGVNTHARESRRHAAARS